MVKKMLVAVDGSEYSKKALEFACDMADRMGSTLHIVHVPQGAAADRVLALGGAAIMIHAPPEVVEEAGRKVIDGARKIAEASLGDRVTTELRSGDPAEEIVASADELGADCIVVGSRGLGDFGSLLLGSVSNKVNHSATCTCVTVH